MSVLERLNQRLGFTRNESLVVLFLTGSLLVGGAIKVVKDVSGNDSGHYNYEQSDRQFAILAQRADSISESEQETTKISSASVSLKKSKTKLPAGTINVNTASKEELMSLPGVGETMAERMMIYREEHGPFKTLEELESVKGIGKKKISRFAQYITFE